MPNQPKTTIRPVRLDDDLWQAFGEVADPDRSTIIRQFVAWYVRKPGSRLPQRPVPDSRSSDPAP